jgi:hypothetical protein
MEDACLDMNDPFYGSNQGPDDWSSHIFGKQDVVQAEKEGH